MAVLLLLWVAALVAVPLRNHFEAPAWDVVIYMKAVDSVRIGHDPYADAIAIQQRFHEELALHPKAQVPFSYVYSPITLPVLKLVAISPLWLSAIVYGLIYLCGLLAQIWGGYRAAEPRERSFVIFLTAAAAFFPGFLASDIVWSGNVAFILYGMVMLAAIHGWRTRRWTWFYIAVVAASCVKAPLLSLVVIAPLSESRQWLKATAASAVGLGLFAVQPLLWPSLFHHYLEAVELQFSYNRDFGSSPAGLFSGVLFDHGLHYSPASYFFYLGYALPLFATLVYLSRKYLRSGFTLQQWVPVLLVGVILLNPRVLEYDEIWLAIPLALIAWRFFAAFASTGKAIALSFALFLALNVVAYQNWQIWKLVEGPLLVVFFSAGSWNLVRQSRDAANKAASEQTFKQVQRRSENVPELQLQASQGR